MSDNTSLNPGTGGDTIATDDIGGVKHQKVKVEFGANDSATQVDASNPLPVTDAGIQTDALTNTELRASAVPVDGSGVTQPVSGTVAASNLPSTVDTNSGNKSASTVRVVLATDQPALTNKLLVTPDLPSGAATSAKQDTGNTSLASIDGKITAVNTGAVVVSSGTLTADTELTTADLDTGAGTDTRAVIGLVGSKSGGGVLIPGDATKGLAVDLSATGANTNKLLVTPDLPSGAATAAKQPALGTAGTASADVITVQGKASMTPVLIDGSATTQPVSGTVTANAGTNLNTSALATSTNITGGSQKTQVVDGSGNVIGATSNALDVNIKSGSSSGTQYAEDVASTGGESMNIAGAVRQDTISSNTSTDGDYTYLKTTSAGRLYTDAAVSAALPAGTNVIGHVIADSGSTTAVTGSVTVAQGTATNLKVDASGVAVPITDNSGSLTVDNGGTFAVQASVAAGAANIAKAEDVASADADVGVPSMAVRKATPANTSSTDGDYEMLQISAGRLWVDASGKTLTTDGSGTTQPVSYATTGHGTASGSLRVELPTDGTGVLGLNAGTNSIGKISDITTSVVPGAGATNLGKAEDAAHSSGDTGVFALGVRNDSLGTTFTSANGDYSPIAVDSTGALSVANTVTPADRVGSGSLTTTDSTVVATTNGCTMVSFIISGTWSATLLIEASIDGGSTWNAIDGDIDSTDTIINNTTNNGLITVNCASYNQVRLRANPYTSGTANVKWSAGAGLSLVEVFNTNASSLKTTDAATGATAASVPASASLGANVTQTTLPTANTSGQLTANMGDKFGRQVILNNGIRDIMGTQTTTVSASTSETTIITAAASVFNDLSALWVSNTSATAARVDIRDTTSGSIIFQFYVPAGDMRGFSLTTPWPQTSSNTNWTITSSASVTDLRVSALFIKNK